MRALALQALMIDGGHVRQAVGQSAGASIRGRERSRQTANRGPAVQVTAITIQD